jgi:hypothetical protein
MHSMQNQILNPQAFFNAVLVDNALKPSWKNDTWETYAARLLSMALGDGQITPHDVHQLTTYRRGAAIGIDFTELNRRGLHPKSWALPLSLSAIQRSP